MFEKLILFLGQEHLIVGLGIALMFAWILANKLLGAKGLSPQDLVSLVNNQDKQAQGLKIVDIRAKKDFKKEKLSLSNMTNIESSSSNAKQSFASMKDSLVVLVCDSGIRSKSLANDMQDEGFEVRFLDGGIFEWKSAKLPTSSG